MSVDVGSIVRVKPEALRHRALAHRQFRIVQVTPNGFTKLFDDQDSRLLPAWYPSTDLINFDDVTQLPSRVRGLREAIAAAKKTIGANAQNVDEEVLALARAEAEEHDLDLATATQRVLANPAHAALATAWHQVTARPAVSPAREDLELTERARARQRASAAAGRPINFRTAVHEESCEDRDLAERVVGVIHLTRRDDGSWARESAARDVELRRVIPGRLDLSRGVARTRR